MPNRFLSLIIESISVDRCIEEGAPLVRKLLAALSRTFYRPHSSNSVGALQGLPDPEQDEVERWIFTLSDMPPVARFSPSAPSP